LTSSEETLVLLNTMKEAALIQGFRFNRAAISLIAEILQVKRMLSC